MVVLFVSSIAPAGATQQNVASSILPNVKLGGSTNLTLLSHIPLGGFFRVSGVEIEEGPARPYVYVAQMRDRAGFTIVDIRDPEHAKVLYRWRFPGADPTAGLGALQPRYFKSKGRYYLALGVQFAPDSPNADVGAVIFDVTSLPDTTKIREVARIRSPAFPGGFRAIFAYKHSDGRALLFAAANGPRVEIYDLDRVVAGEADSALVGTIGIPGNSEAVAGYAGYEDLYVGFDTRTHEDRFYGAGTGGYYVYNVTRPQAPRLLTSVVGSAGVTEGSSITPTPDGRYLVTGTGIQYSPLRIFDLEPGLAGKVQTIHRPVGAWTADWHDAIRGHELRWPLVFVSSLEDGLQIFNMTDPENPQTVAWYYTCQCAHQTGFGDLAQVRGGTVINGAFGVDVRNSDGLIAVSDANTGFWLFRLDGFGGWKGDDFSMPNVTSAQDWDRGPLVATGTINLIP
jgi:hypothetical protein